MVYEKQKVMNSRDKILATIKANQPEHRELPPEHVGQAGSWTAGAGTADGAGDLTPRFISVLEAIGGAAFLVSGYDRIATILREQFPDARRILTSCPQLNSFAAASTLAAGLDPVSSGDPHSLENVDLAILPAHFGVAENGACWLTESQMIERALPFIAQHLALVVSRTSIVPTMHQAYARIAEIEAAGANASAEGSASAGGSTGSSYGFATFIAGPSKTADIEQSLVLGAHGPKSLTVFLLDEHLSDAGFF
jgi:L-lactate dehydrogenase complex protein LldG